ncbi:MULTISPECIES: TIR-like protein FxsC [unclassified Plantactinospora]|uniref:TIR-like protein FxsC n=1 Tax=unclassified Plantactinospora TaxID=2631981 RepID=UPI002982A204|nr:TIR-like protein FxsC [Plantactinospora sp. KLBMP9567]MDW5328216.1 TIR-like protein FxsC [Plantactinospora sp. KLBMP9567]
MWGDAWSTAGERQLDDGRVVDDPLAPLFFVSYAVIKPPRRTPGGRREANTNALRLFSELSIHVNALVSRPTGADPGYIDRNMRGGERWTPDLLEAVGTCQVFVALLSPAYLDSEWCAREWNLFASRTVVRRDGRPSNETCILPVSWTPADSCEPPNYVQRFSPDGTPDEDLVPTYHQEGLYGLLSMKDPASDVVLWKLAQRIVELSRSHWVEPRVLTTPGGIARKFSRRGT